MINASIHRKCFNAYFIDAASFTHDALTIEGRGIGAEAKRLRHARSAILYSSLALESAANCCLDVLKLQKKSFEELEKLKTLSKFEMFLQHVRPRCHIKRDDPLVQPIENLISCRDQYVHSKVFKEPIVEGVPQMTMWQPLGLPKNQDYWQPLHALKVFTVTSDFLNYFFFNLCGFPYEGGKGRAIAASILTSSIYPKAPDKLPDDVPSASIKENYRWLILDYEKIWDLEFAFFGFGSTGPDNKPIYPKRKWGDYSHCDLSKIEVPVQPITFDIPSGIGIFFFGPKDKIQKLYKKET
jgi:hypothetical protein